MSIRRVTVLALVLLSPMATLLASAAQANPTSVVLVELFTSEGCSSCPPADEILQQLNGRRTKDGALLIGLSEHVSYWNQLGWADPFSSDVSTRRQNEYSKRFHTEGPYTPQMVVNGREQLVGSDRVALNAAVSKEAGRKQVELHITQATVTNGHVTFAYSASGVPASGALDLVAAFVDDSDRSTVQRGENAGRSLEHVFVVRTLARVAMLQSGVRTDLTLAVPIAAQTSGKHHLVLFAQQPGLGAVVGVDARAL